MEQNGNGQHADDFRMPEWVCMLIGKLTLENEALRQALASVTQQQQQMAEAPAAERAEA